MWGQEDVFGNESLWKSFSYWFVSQWNRKQNHQLILRRGRRFWRFKGKREVWHSHLGKWVEQSEVGLLGSTKIHLNPVIMSLEVRPASTFSLQHFVSSKHIRYFKYLNRWINDWSEWTLCLFCMLLKIFSFYYCCVFNWNVLCLIFIKIKTFTRWKDSLEWTCIHRYI